MPTHSIRYTIWIASEPRINKTLYWTSVDIWYFILSRTTIYSANVSRRCRACRGRNSESIWNRSMDREGIEHNFTGQSKKVGTYRKRYGSTISVQEKYARSMYEYFWQSNFGFTDFSERKARYFLPTGGDFLKLLGEALEFPKCSCIGYNHFR